MTSTIQFNSDDEKTEARAFLLAMCQTMYVAGECYEFAIALHRGLGWPMFGLMLNNQIFHAGVTDPDGNLYDARGLIPMENLGEPFDLRSPFVLREISEEEIARDDKTMSEFSIARARRLAEAIWPKLPWKNSLVSQVHAFTAELVALSRKHGIWIRSQTPGSQPILAFSDDGDETGYKVEPTFDRLSFTIDRSFK